eukprot:CAMPEP_0203759114 /NCGR_PEP_ID=MMETSP0098-20131031/12048_1 /ASSEMBLY_ACC=CAM_ASM_000208 /TAXON_ID=96639 /ORGANISM=" , Strain NY0313808BC1" /LENGTH=282 /DNA_ID=CAMNT_0050651871 /DNA_START=214 /DNA_END=1062 /DNA_ORIENTATION=+
MTRNARASDTSLPPVNGHRGMASTANKEARAQNISNATKPRRRTQGGIGATTVDKPYTSARLNAVRNSSLNKRPAIPPPLPGDRGKLTVILDVDETLIHSRLSSQQESYRQVEERKDSAASCDEFTITLEDGEMVRVNKRPGLDKFLRHMSENYETLAYTAGLEEYAKPLLDWLDPDGTVFRHRLYRDSCLFMRGYYLKDLQKVNRPLNRTVLVDNNAFCFLPQLGNGIPISSFYDDPNDSALSVLTTFLERLRDEKDVRPFLRKSFNLETLLKDHREQIVG